MTATIGRLREVNPLDQAAARGSILNRELPQPSTPQTQPLAVKLYIIRDGVRIRP